MPKKRNVKIQIQLSGAPYPNECWWKIRGANGRIYVCSELMDKNNAMQSILNVVTAIKENRYSIQTLPPQGQKMKK